MRKLPTPLLTLALVAGVLFSTGCSTASHLQQEKFTTAMPILVQRCTVVSVTGQAKSGSFPDPRIAHRLADGLFAALKDRGFVPSRVVAENGPMASAMLRSTGAHDVNLLVEISSFFQNQYGMIAWTFQLRFFSATGQELASYKLGWEPPITTGDLRKYADEVLNLLLDADGKLKDTTKGG